MALIAVLNGPNLNLLGIREPGLYGKKSLQEIQAGLENSACDLGHQLTFMQSNAEHEIIEHIHSAFQQRVDFIIINPAAFTHTSVAIQRCLAGDKNCIH